MCYSSDCEVILDVQKGILRFTVGHSKFVKHVDVDFVFQVFKSKLFLFTDFKIIDFSVYWRINMIIGGCLPFVWGKWCCGLFLISSA